jgi:hypothetical protein
MSNAMKISAATVAFAIAAAFGTAAAEATDDVFADAPRTPHAAAPANAAPATGRTEGQTAP